MKKINDFDVFQKKCKSTAVYPKVGENFVYPVLGLLGESGEVAEKVKKIFRDDGGKINKEKKDEIVKELGDVLWYIAQISTELNVRLSEVVRVNREKLTSRMKRNVVHGSGDNR